MISRTQNTSIPDDKDTLLKIANQVISELNDMNIRPVPACYEGWFNYKTNLDQDFADAIDKIVKTKNSLTEEEFVSIRQQIEHGKLSVDKFNAAVEDLFNHITGLESCRDLLSGSTKALNEEIEHTREKLSDPLITISKVREIVEKFSSELANAEAKNKKLEEKLSASFSQVEDLKQSVRSFQNKVNTDALTGVYNRRYFDECLEREVSRVKENKKESILLVLDIDFFKSFNDLHGHDTGDQVIKYTAQVLKRNTRYSDVVARYGGDEFVIMLRDTSLSDGETFAKQLCKKVSEKKLKSRVTNTDLGRLTVTVGGTKIDQADTAESAFRRADGALLAAKRAGRNRCLMVPSSMEAA